MDMKIAISVPDDIFKAGERLARDLGLARSQLDTQALEAYLERSGERAVTARLTALYGSESSDVDPALARAQVCRIADEAW